MRQIIFFIWLIYIFTGCSTLPRNFTYHYTGEYTGLDTLINTNGYYISQYACDTAFYSMYLFFPNGLFTIATTSRITPELIDYFEAGGMSKTIQYPLWGTYQIEGDLIKTQVIRTEGSSCVIFRDYRILPDGMIENISDFVEPQYTRLSYMANYPSFKDNPCKIPAEFHPLKLKMNN